MTNNSVPNIMDIDWSIMLVALRIVLVLISCPVLLTTYLWDSKRVAPQGISAGLDERIQDKVLHTSDGEKS
jgi:hypothetical protein